MADAITIEIWNPADTVQTEDFPIPKDTPDALAEVTNIRWSIYSGLGIGRGGCTIHKDVESLDVGEGYILRIKDAADQQQYIGRIISAIPAFEDNRVYSDKMIVVADNELVARVPKIAYTLLEDDVEGSVKEVTTTINAVFQDIMEGGQHAGKETTNKMPLKDFCAITYSAGNNTLPSTSIGISYDEVNAYQALIEMIHAANGTLPSGERYVWYLDRNNELFTKQRSASILATFDIGTYSGTNYDNFISDSDDIEGRLVTLDGDLSGIHNKFFVNKVAINSSQHSSEETSSQTTHGVRPLYINDSRVGLNSAALTLFWDGINLGMFEPLIGYEFPLKSETYGDAPFFPTAPDGYIRLTKDGGTLFVDLPFREIHINFSSGRYLQRLVMGGYRPDIYTFRLYQDSQKPVQTTEPDNTPPRVTALDRRPTAFDKTYTQHEQDIYIGCNANDLNGIAAGSSKAYLSKLTEPSTWGAYDLIGTLDFNAAPDSDSDAFYEYNQDDGYYDLITDGGLAVGDIFAIKIIARDPSGNVGQSVREFQLGEDTPDITVTVNPPAAEEFDFPVVLSVDSDDGFALRVDLKTQSIDTVTCVYSGDAITTTRYDDATGSYYLTDDMTIPGKGKVKVAVITATNKTGKVTKQKKYIKGEEPATVGPSVVIKEPSDTISEDTTTVQQFKDTIEFTIQFKEPGYIVTASTVKFKIYSKPTGLPFPWGSSDPVLEKTLTSATTPAVYETSAGSGIFKVGTDVTELALSSGFYRCAAEITKAWIPVDESAVEKTPRTITIETEMTQFQILTSQKTLGKDLGDTKINVTSLEDRMTPAEESIVDGANKIVVVGNVFELTDGTLTAVKLGKELQDDSGNAHIEHDSGTDEWKATTTGGGTVVLGAGTNPQGTNFAFFEINHDDSSETEVYLVLNANSGSDKGALAYEYNAGSPRLRIAIDFDEGTPSNSTWTDLTTGTQDKIADTFSAQLYELEVDDTDGSLTYTKDVGGTPVVIFKLERTGAITVKDDSGNTILTMSTLGVITTYNDMAPDTDIDSTMGDTTHRYAEIHGEEVNCKDLIFTNDGTTEKGSFTYHAGSDRIVPDKILLGFTED